MADAPYSLSLNEYQKQCLRLANPALSPEMRKATFGLGVAGEAGEVADLIKKELGHGHTMEQDVIAKELGDVLWYIATLAQEYGLTLQDVGQRNLNKLLERYPEGFDPERSKKRKKNDK